ncbi:MAG: hypothetical protein LUD17_13650 [Bacteroidales bacterium]|nr:hypothetical protein [Bacteroidales bacterium]
MKLAIPKPMPYRLNITFDDKETAYEAARLLSTLPSVSIEEEICGAHEQEATYGTNPQRRTAWDKWLSPSLREQRKQWRKQLDEIEGLEQDWDEEGAYPVEKSLIALVREFVANASERILKNWWVAPVANGSLLIAPEAGGNSSVSIGTNGIAFYAAAPQREMSGELPSQSGILLPLMEILTLMLKP